MKIQALLIALIVAYGSLVGMISVDGDTQGTKTLVDFYERSISKMISRYQMVASLYNNLKFNTIREKAQMATQKVNYLKKHKNDLISEMINEGLGKKSIKIEWYLDQQFKKYKLAKAVEDTHTLTMHSE